MPSTIGGLPGTEDLEEFLRQQALKNAKVRTMGGVPVAPRSPLLPSEVSVPTGVPTKWYKPSGSLAEQQYAEEVLKKRTPQVAEADVVARGASPAAQVAKGAAPRGGGLLTAGIISALAGPAANFGSGLAHMAMGDKWGGGKYDLGQYEGGLPDISAGNPSPERTGIANDQLALPVSGYSKRPAQPGAISALSGENPMAIKLPTMQPQLAQDLEVVDEMPAELEQQQAIPTSTIEDHIAQLLGQQRELPTEGPSQISTTDMSQLTQPKKIEKPKEGFGRGLKRFLVAGSGPLDFTRLDRQELELAQQQQQFTPQEALRAQIAMADIGGAQKFNRDVKMHDYETGGMSPQSVEQLHMLEGDRAGERQHAYKGQEQEQEHGFRMGEIGASAANQKLSPEQSQLDFLRKMAVEFPDVVGQQGLASLGMQTSPESLQVIADARKKTDMMDMMLYQMMIEKGLIHPGAVGTSPPTHPSGSAPTPPKNLNLRALQH